MISEDIDKFEDCIFGIQFLNEAGAVVYENVKYYTYNQERLQIQAFQISTD